MRRNPITWIIIAAFGILFTIGMLFGEGLMVHFHKYSNPGPLSAARAAEPKAVVPIHMGGISSHADFEQECGHCHAPLHCVTDTQCQDCHLEIAEQRLTATVCIVPSQMSPNASNVIKNIKAARHPSPSLPSRISIISSYPDLAWRSTNGITRTMPWAVKAATAKINIQKRPWIVFPATFRRNTIRSLNTWMNLDRTASPATMAPIAWQISITTTFMHWKASTKIRTAQSAMW